MYTYSTMGMPILGILIVMLVIILLIGMIILILMIKIILPTCSTARYSAFKLRRYPVSCKPFIRRVI